MHRLSLSLTCLATAAPVVAFAQSPAATDDTASYEPSSVRLGGFLQTQYRKRQNAGGNFDADDTDGFRLARVRLIGLGETRAGNLELSAFVEAELQPSFFLADGFVTASRRLPKRARVAIDAGQMRVPISRQNLLSDSRLAFVDKGQIATIAPDRDLGLRVTFDAPRLDDDDEDRRRPAWHIPAVRAIAAAYNGEGPNQVENVNERYFYVGRLEVTPFGEPQTQLAESAFGGKFLTIGGSLGRNRRNEGNRLDEVTYAGVDVSGSYRGLSGTFEYLQVTHAQTQGGIDDPNVDDFAANGFVAQLCYLLPLRLPPFRQARLEVGVRLEEVDRNDTVPIVAPADPNQSVRAVTAVVSYYLRMHTLKAQLAFTSFTEVEDRTAADDDARFANDQLLLQVTYRME